MAKRSRACKECRQRRIGCTPEATACRQCRVTNRTCSGPETGLIIVHCSEPASRIPRRKTHPTAIVHQPSPATIVSLAYVEAFFDTMTPLAPSRRTRPWLVRAKLLSQREKGPALDLAIEAAATAACGVASGNTVLVIQARQMYHTVIVQHARIVANSDVVPSSIFFTTVALSLFESFHSTSTAAFAAHLRAARRMLSMAGEELSRMTIVKDIAIYVQYQTLLAMLVAPADYLASADDRWQSVSDYEWVGVPAIMGRLVIHLFHLGDSFTRSSYWGQPADKECNIEAAELLWDEYVAEANDRNEVIQWTDAGKTYYRDEITAITVAYFEAARILHALQTSDDCLVGWKSSSRSIIRCVLYLSTQSTSCATLRIFFPLTLVALHGACQSEARSLLNTWLARSGFSGLYSVLDTHLKTLHRLDTPPWVQYR